MIRRKIAELLLPEQVESINRLKGMYEQMLKRVPNTKELVREQMFGFDKRMLYDDSDYEENEKGELTDDFLSHVHDLDENPALDMIIMLLKREQVMFTALEAENIEQVNFGRATINGLQLIREETDRLVGIYNQRHAGEGDYDHSEVV